jgi:hypothetical protein
MQELILEKGLRRSEEYAEIRDVARARTLAALRSLDGNRKGQVARFLHEADLIGALRKGQVIEAIIDLRGADLSGAAGGTNQQLAQAKSLGGATLPDGTVMTEETWEEFKKCYRLIQVIVYPFLVFALADFLLLHYRVSGLYQKSITILIYKTLILR